MGHPWATKGSLGCLCDSACLTLDPSQPSYRFPDHAGETLQVCSSLSPSHDIFRSLSFDTTEKKLTDLDTTWQGVCLWRQLRQHLCGGCLGAALPPVSVTNVYLSALLARLSLL